MQTARADSLTWDVTPDVGRFSEAIQFFTSRVVMTRDEAFALDDDSRRRAFWVGGGLQLTQVQRVFDEIGKALESGEDFKAFRKRVLADVAISKPHLDTVFRNATQRAYNAGRWEQMQAAKALRPYVMFDVVLDDRTTKDICMPLDGKIVSIDDPFLKAHSPQRHHRCRTGLRSLRAKDAERRGIAPKDELDGAPAAATGFGVIPTEAPVWKPDKKRHDAKLVEELEKKEAKPKKAKKPKGPPPEHDPAHWEAHYRKPTEFAPKGYGDASTAMAHGRAMLERGLDRPIGEIVEELKRLHAAGLPGISAGDIKFFERMKPTDTLRKKPMPAAVRGFAALSEHTRTIKVGDFQLPAFHQNVFEAQKFYKLTLDASVKRPDEWIITVNDEDIRAYAHLGTKEINISENSKASTVVHELAHAIESTDKRALQRSVEFLKARTEGEQLRSMRELTGRDYDDHEVGRGDKFRNKYTGKEYPNGIATEVTSMAYEQMSSPLGGIGDLATDDPDLLFFALGQLAGK